MPPKSPKAEGAGGEDIAERMVKLDGYLKSLWARRRSRSPPSAPSSTPSTCSRSARS